jgi:hypothetical protein
MSEWKEVKCISGPDGKRMLVLENSEGLFRFQEETRLIEKSPYTEGRYTFWVPTHVSGFYGSAGAAEQAGCVELPWLREPDSK